MRDYINVHPKTNEYPAESAARNQNKKIMKKLKTKNGDAQKKQSGREVGEVSPEAGRESMVGKTCERGRS